MRPSSTEPHHAPSTKKYNTFREFWPFYLGEHTHPTNRLLHVLGSASALAWAVAALITHNGWYVLAAIVQGYAFAWFGHFVIEKNRPATLSYPFKSFAADWLMFVLIVTGRLKKK